MSHVFFIKEGLNDLYYNQKKSTREIAKEYNVGKTTVEYYLKKFGIPLRKHKDAMKLCGNKCAWTKGLSKEKDSRIKAMALKIKRAYQMKSEHKIKLLEQKCHKSFRILLYDLYWIDGLNQEQIAKKLGYDRGTIIRLMRRFDISKRCNYGYITSLKGANHSMFGKTWEDIHGKEKANVRKKESSKRFRKLIIKRLENNEFPFFDTEIEKIIAKELLKINIPFVKQFKIENKFVCDFAIPSLKIVIECDGDYWHANPKIYSGANLTRNQKKNLQRDKFKDLFLAKRGWTILRFTESDIHKNLPFCRSKLQEVINSKIEELKKIKSSIDSLIGV